MKCPLCGGDKSIFFEKNISVIFGAVIITATLLLISWVLAPPEWVEYGVMGAFYLGGTIVLLLIRIRCLACEPEFKSRMM